jgi:potassium voltage-gated channel Shab-related subfamily B protein 2
MPRELTKEEIEAQAKADASKKIEAETGKEAVGQNKAADADALPTLQDAQPTPDGDAKSPSSQASGSQAAAPAPPAAPTPRRSRTSLRRRLRESWCMRHLHAQVAFVVNPLNIIDLFAFLFYYIGLAAGDGEADGAAPLLLPSALSSASTSPWNGTLTTPFNATRNGTYPGDRSGPPPADQTLTLLRVVRLARILRLLKLGRKSSGLAVLYRTMRTSLEPLVFLSLFVGIVAIICAAMVFYTEEGEWDPVRQAYMRTDWDGERRETPFQSIPHGIWWALVTVATVGYGDMVPASAGGKFIGGLTILMGILTLAMPNTVIGTAFTIEYRRMRDELTELQSKRRRERILDAQLAEKMRKMPLTEEDKASSKSDSKSDSHSGTRRNSMVSSMAESRPKASKSVRIVTPTRREDAGTQKAAVDPSHAFTSAPTSASAPTGAIVSNRDVAAMTSQVRQKIAETMRRNRQLADLCDLVTAQIPATSVSTSAGIV